MLFSALAPIPPDPILGMAQLFAADPSPHKVDLGIGIYKDETGAAPVLASVKAAEQQLVDQQTSKAYLSSAGNPEFNRVTAQLLLGESHPALADDRVRAVQTPGGTAALRVAADFIRTHRPSSTVWLPDPTWANHPAIFGAAGLRLARYPYYESAGARLLFDRMIDTLSRAAAGDVVVLHGCCHNPTGADLSEAQWDALAETLRRSSAIPLVDLAYQGFGAGIEADAYAVRKLARDLPEMLIASSYSKNFALYRDRAGAITLVSDRGIDADLVRAHLLRTIRTNYSMPPDHGAAVVAHILSSPAARSVWESELLTMAGRIRQMRTLLAQQLRGRTPRSYDFIAAQRGMFTSLGLTPQDVVRLRVEHSVHISSSGRINLAGLTRSNVARVADALVAVHATAG
jgi:aspartate aminotransferase